jgi:hypothetical protein
MPLEFDGVNGIVKNTTSDGDVTIKGNDDGSEISALVFDMSASGKATFNSSVFVGNHLYLGDNKKAIFGAGEDLIIYHDGSNSYIQDDGTGGLYLKANADFVVQSKGSDENMIYGASNAFVKLYHNGSEKIATSSTGIDITGGFTATDGCTITTADNDPQLILTSTDADADEGPRMNFVRNSGSPANNDVLARISLQGKDAGANTTSYAELETTAVNVAEGSETGKFNIKVAVAGSVNQDVITMTGSEVVINDSSNDVDFRVEGNGDANLLFVDAGNDRIGVGTNSPAKLLSLKKDGGGGAIGIDIHNQGTNAADDALITFETQGHRNYSMGIDRSTSSFVVMSEADGLGTARITVNDDGKVGILNSSPGDFNDQGDHLVVGSGSGDTGITLYSGSGSGDSGNIFFADGTSGSDPVRGGITYKHDDNSMLFRVNDVNRLTIASNGDATFSGAIGAAGTTTTLAGIAIASENNSIFMSDSDIMDTSDTAAFDTVYGWTAGNALTTGDSNTLIGYAAGTAITTGQGNIMIGESAGDGFDTEGNNLGVGNGALGGSVAGGEYNVAIGNLSLDALTSGDDNVALGYNALGALTTGSDNVAIGSYALDAGTGSDFNVAIGHNALTSNTANNCTAVGYLAGEDNTAHELTAFGSKAAMNNTSGGGITAIGREAYNNADTESHNTAIGLNSIGGAVNGGEYNVAVGNYSLDALTSADKCTAVGYTAGSGITTGYHNTLIGHEAGLTMSTSVENTVVGSLAGKLITTGNGANVIVGYNSGASITTGVENIHIGAYAGDGYDTESHNLSIGRSALGGAVAGGEYNVAIGNYSLDALTSADKITAVGYQAGSAHTTGANCVFMGYQAGLANTTGASIVAIGANAYDQPDTESHNIAIGNDAMHGAIAGGEYNIAIGSNALDALTSGDRTVAIGYNAGTDIQDGARNTFMGYEAGKSNVSGNYNVAIGYNAGTTRMSRFCTVMGYNSQITADDGEYQIVVGTDSLVSVGSGKKMTVGSSNGNDRVHLDYGTDATWTRVSDERYKENIQPNTDCGLDFINDLNPVTFTWKAKADIDSSLPDYDATKLEPTYDKKMYGMIAQEVKAAMDKHNITDFGGWNVTETDGIQGIAQGMFVHPLIKAVQELSAKVKALEEA